MSKNDRTGQFTPYVVLVIGLVLVGFAASQFATSRAYHAAYEYYERSHYQYEIAKSQKAECSARATIKEALDCYEISQGASRENHRDEQDLNAQRQMADWAFWMTVVTLGIGILTVGVAALGVYWVKETLTETRKAVKAANDAVEVTDRIGKAQSQAYISFDRIDVFYIGDDSNHITGVQFRPYIKNTGQTPAYIRLISSAVYIYTDRPLNIDFPIAKKTPSTIRVGSKAAIFLTGSALQWEEVRIAVETDQYIIVVCGVEFEDVFFKSGEARRTEEFAVRAVFNGPLTDPRKPANEQPSVEWHDLQLEVRRKN